MPEQYLGNKLSSTGWIIDARWYYAPLAFFLGMIAGRDSAPPVYTQAPLLGLLLLAIIFNLVFYFAMRNLRFTKIFEKHLIALNIGQILFDMVFFFVIIVITGGGVESIAHSFYFIPIVVSMILFGFRGAMLVAVASGGLIILSVLIQYGVVFPSLGIAGYRDPAYALDLALTKAGILSVIYLLTGFFGAYISRIVRARDTLLLEKITEGEEHVAQLEELTKEFEQSAKLLVRRDLDLSVANQQLQKLDQMKSEIISVAAHQLRTPLSAIKWTLKMLIDEDVGKLSDDQKNLLEKGYESNERMINLINDMLSVDRLESGKVKYNFVPVQFESIVETMIGEVLPLATDKNIKINYAHPEQLLPKIRLDPEKIKDVLQNLIDNGIKYSRRDSTVTVRIASENGSIHFSVQDAGIGIPIDQQDKIFSRFFRAMNAIKTETNGSGLGLFIAQSIVKRHGGEIWFESKEGEGTTFHFTVPFES